MFAVLTELVLSLASGSVQNRLRENGTSAELKVSCLFTATLSDSFCLKKAELFSQ